MRIYWEKAIRGNLFRLTIGLLVGCTPTPAPQFFPEEEPEKLVYIVQAGDVLPIIALQHGENYRDLARWNELEPPYALYPGQKLRLTPPANFSAPRESNPEIPSEAPIKKIPQYPPEDSSPVSTEHNNLPWRWPTQGKILRGFSADNQGLDISGVKGSPIAAVADGKVVYSGSGIIGYGPLIIVKHNETYLSAYAHNQKILVQEGDQVMQGQKIAEMGVNQRNNPVLHFEIRRNGKSVDPLKYLPRK